MIDIVEYSDEYKKEVSNLIVQIIFDELQELFDRNEVENENYLKYKKNGGRMFLALEYGKVIGTLAVEYDEDSNYKIKRVYVKKEKRKLGAAKLLMNQAFMFLKNNNANKVKLATYKKYVAANIFYKNYGFKEIENSFEDETVVEYQYDF